MSLSSKTEEHWDLIIRPKTNLFDLNLKHIWEYRDLLILFVKRDFVSQYKQTILGPLWHLIQPIFTTVMFLLVFGRIANIPTDSIQPALFYMSGITIWNYFATCLTVTSTTFINNASIFGKVYFPRLVLPLSIVLSNMIRFGIQFSLLIILMIWYNFHNYSVQIRITWLNIPLIVFLMAGIGLGLGIIISSLTTKYRDLSILLTFVIQLAIYATPVAYPMSFLQNKPYKWIIDLNPLTSLVEWFRFSLFGHGTFTIGGILYSTTFMIISVIMGSLIFNKVEKNFMDTI